MVTNFFEKPLSEAKELLTLDLELLQRGFIPQPLTPAQYRALDTNGFIILEGIIAPDWLAELRHAFDAIFTKEGDEAGAEVAQMEGVRRLADLVNKGTVFDAVYLQPTLLTAVFHVLQRPFKLHSLNGHDPLPGSGLQILHADWGKPTVPAGRITSSTPCGCSTISPQPMAQPAASPAATTNPAESPTTWTTAWPITPSKCS